MLGVICFGTLWPMLLATVQGFGAVGLLSNALLTRVEHPMLRWMRSGAPGF